MYANGLCLLNAQNVTWVNADNANCIDFYSRGKSTINTGGQGVPYFPSNAHHTLTASVTAGSNTITVSSNVGINWGAAVNGCVSPTASFGAGATSINVSSANFIQVGNYITGPGIAGGTSVTSVAGTTISLSAPTISAQSGVTLRFKGTGVANGTYVEYTQNNTVFLSQPVVSSQTNLPLWFSGSIQTGGQYQ